MDDETSSTTGNFDSDAVSLDVLGTRIVTLAGRLAAATCRWLLLVAAFDRRDGAHAAGLPSTAHWLGHACGLARRTAVEQVRVARALAAFPALAAEMAAGRVSYSHARAISRVARDGETQLVDDLIEIARHGTVAHLEAMVRGLRTIDDNHTGDQTDPGEYLTGSWADDSRWRLSAKLDPERGALVDAALRRLANAEQVPLHEALLRMAEITLAALDDTRDDHGKRGVRELRGDERAAVIIHLDATRMITPTGGDADDAEAANASTDLPPDDDADGAARSAERAPARPTARLTGGPGLPDRVVQRLLCAGRVRTIIHGGDPADPATSVLDMGRTHRLVTDKQYRALLTRHHGHCAYPGCHNTKRLHAHHITHWLHGGRTNLTNLILLCEAHHTAHHDGDYTITALPNNRFRFVRHDGHNLEKPEPAAEQTFQPETWLHTHHSHIHADHVTTKWDGQRLQHNYAINVLATRRYQQQ